MIAGLWGYGTVVVVVALLDLLSGRAPFHTLSQLGVWLTQLGGGVADGSVWAPLLAYNGLHVLASLLAGVIGAFAVLEAERYGSIWYLGFMALIAMGIYALGALGSLAVEVLAITDWRTIIIGTGSWLAAISAYLLWIHRRLFSLMAADLEPD